MNNLQSQKNNTLSVPLEKMQPFKCECGSIVFRQLTQLRLLPAIMSPTAKKELITIPVYVCETCGTQYDLTSIL
jgi:hypothetical protein